MFTNCRLITRDAILPDQAVFCSKGRIERIGSADGCSWPEAGTIVDAGGRYLAPGFIDLHMHGTMNQLVDEGPDHLAELCRILPRYGVTAFLPSVAPQPGLTAAADLDRLAEIAGATSEGAAMLGFFLEGYFLALTGALPDIPKDQSLGRVLDLIAALRPHRLVFGISPEIEGICNLLPAMTRQGFPAFITHTCATAGQTEQAIMAGAVHATHFYDVFPYPGEKDPGVRSCGAVEAILASPQTSVDFILDGEHVDPIAVKMALQCKGPDKVCLITDANANAGLPPGRYKSTGGTEITVAYDGAPARSGLDSPIPGALNGSGLTMDRAVRNAVNLLGVSLPQAVAMASANPARVLGLQDSKGQIRPGFDADLVLLDDRLQVAGCWVGGAGRFMRT